MDDSLYCCSMSDASETPGAAAELLSALGFDLSTWTDAETKAVRHTLYFQDEAAAKKALEAIVPQSKGWMGFGVVLSDFRLDTLKREDWAESWKIHFKAMEISPRLAIKPSWVELKPKEGQAVVELDPGMSFGTGQHATTKFCLMAIDRFAAEKPGGKLSLLDAGCGSGILSISAFKLGYRPVSAFDIDPDAVAIAKENVSRNGVGPESIGVATSSLVGYSPEKGAFDVVAANILSSALLEGRGKLLSLVKPGGRLILAGILSTEYEKVKAAFEESGCEELFSGVEAEWRGGAFRVP